MGAYKDKNGTWYAQFRFTNWKGEADRKTKRGFATKKEALEWEREFLTQNAGSLEMTFEAFYELYKRNLQDRLKKSTWKMKVSVIESKILPRFKKKRMCDIKPKDVVAWQNIMLKARDAKGELYSLVYYYLKLKENFYHSETMVILESMQDGLLYSNLLLKMYLMSLKSNGVLMLSDHLPHTVQTIATYTRHQVGTVERALKIFLEFGLVEILTDGAYYMTDIQLLIGQSSSEGERKRKERMRLQRQKLLPSGVDICPHNDQVDKCPPILEIRDKEIRE